MSKYTNDIMRRVGELVQGEDEKYSLKKNTSLKVNVAEGPEFEGLAKSLIDQLGKEEVSRKAFEIDPQNHNSHSHIYKQKNKLLPNSILKRIGIQDELVAAIVQHRQNIVSQFGRPRPNRMSTGFIFEIRQTVLDRIKKNDDKQKEEEELDKINKRIEVVTELLLNCGKKDLLEDEHDVMTFSQFLSEQTHEALLVGRMATEIISSPNMDGTKQFAGFRVIDAATIYPIRSMPKGENAEAISIRKTAKKMLEEIKGHEIEDDDVENGKYVWAQVIEHTAKQVFTKDECLVHNFYHVPDYELDGFPVTPIDTVISAITTHINITTMNRLFFQNGRAAKGVVVVSSNDIDDPIFNRIKQVFQSSINGVQSSHRLPIIGIGMEDEINFIPLDSQSRDMEFQYLADMNARTIMAAFQVSPDEMGAYNYLSKTTGGALSEAANEHKLDAAQDAGLRPLLARFEDFINQKLLPIIDKELSELCVLKLVGLDADSDEEEAQKLTEDMQIHMSMNDILHKVEKKPLDKALGGDVLLNELYHKNVLDKFCTVGFIMEKVLGVDGASKNPKYDYIRDQFYFEQQTLLTQNKLNEQLMQQGQDEVGKNADEAMGHLQKSETPENRFDRYKKINKLQEKMIDKLVKDWENETQEILATLDDETPEDK